MYFADRLDGGHRLAQALHQFKDSKDTVVLGLVRGGVVTAYAVAKALHLPLGVMSVKKLGAPFQPELAIGAVCSDGSLYINEQLVERIGISRGDLMGESKIKQEEAKRKLALFKPYGYPGSLEGKTVILVDDGLATGATMRASIASARAQGAFKVVVAVPVAAYDSFTEIEMDADEAVALSAPSEFMAVGEFYRDFSQTEDEEVVEYLKLAARDH